MKEIIDYYFNKYVLVVGIIGNYVMIFNIGFIKNVCIGDFCWICGMCCLYNGSINSNEFVLVYIGYGVICDDFIIFFGFYVDDGVMLICCFVG